MPTGRQIQKAFEFFAATMNRYQTARRMPYATIDWIVETETSASSILNLATQSTSAAERILRSVKDELVSRYGRDIGGKLNSEFLQAFDSFGTSLLKASMEGSAGISPNGEAANVSNTRERLETIEVESHP